jgi:hypothetical protein
MQAGHFIKNLKKKPMDIKIGQGYNTAGEQIWKGRTPKI